MDQKIKELWVIPIVVSLSTGIPVAAFFMFLTAYLTGVPIRNPLSLSWFEATIQAPLPVWVTLIIVGIGAAVAGLFIRQRAYLRQQCAQADELKSAVQLARKRLEEVDAQHTAEIEKISVPKPKLHAVWNPAQTLWHMGSHAGKPAMQIGGWISLSTTGTDEIIYLLIAYIGDQQSIMRIDTKVMPNVVQECQIMAFFEPPLESDPSKPFTATIVVEDHLNRRYELPRTTFRATPPPSRFPQVTQPYPVSCAPAMESDSDQSS